MYLYNLPDHLPDVMESAILAFNTSFRSAEEGTVADAESPHFPRPSLTITLVGVVMPMSRHGGSQVGPEYCSIFHFSSIDIYLILSRVI